MTRYGIVIRNELARLAQPVNFINYKALENHRY
ncbi:hypothetical protein MIDIC_40007 [Alphaproteobacteria bacterium]